jgi:hypothetical protein
MPTSNQSNNNEIVEKQTELLEGIQENDIQENQQVQEIKPEEEEATTAATEKEEEATTPTTEN